MATVETDHRSATDAPTAAYEVVMELRVCGEITEDRLEDLGIDIHEVIDGHSSDAIIGCAVEGSMLPPMLSVDMMIGAADLSGVLAELTAIDHLLEDKLPLKVIARDTHIVRSEVPEEDADERELVAC